MDNPKSGCGRLPRSGHLRELFITKFKTQFKRGFTKAVVTRVGRLRAWTQGELRLYYQILKNFRSTLKTIDLISRSVKIKCRHLTDITN